MNGSETSIIVKDYEIRGTHWKELVWDLIYKNEINR